jgi:hypothetical protein
LDKDTYGQYFPATQSIVMNQETVPQHNPNMETMGNILRHESVHALLPKHTVAGIESFLQSNPGDATTMRTNLARTDPDAAASNRTTAEEAPAYAVQGYGFGLPTQRLIAEYLKHMPEPIRTKYLQLLRGNAPGGH